MRLLLDEMISPRVARGLRGRGFDVQAIKGDRPDLEASADRELVRRMIAEGRALVTNDVLDFQPIHNQLAAAGEEHAGLIFTNDREMPRNKASIPLWIETLGRFLEANPQEVALRNRIWHLPCESSTQARPSRSHH
jgi:predicted nuclease of predicted toxin-antitoxin system